MTADGGLQLDIYAGTMLPHVPLIDRRPLLRRWQPARIYYDPLMRLGRELACYADMVCLYGAGLGDPRARFVGTDQVVHRKAARHHVSRRIVIGHSQGGLQALEDCLRHPDEVIQANVLSAPLGGINLARLADPLPAAHSMVPGSAYLTELWQLQADLIKRWRADPSLPVPEIRLFSTHRDVLVGCSSAHWLHPDYPRVERFCLSYWAPHHDHPASWIRAGWWEDNHLGMIWSPHLVDSLAAGLRRVVGADKLPVAPAA